MEDHLYSLLLVLTAVVFAALVRNGSDLLWWMVGAAGALVLPATLRPQVTVTQVSLLLCLCSALALADALSRRLLAMMAGIVAIACHQRFVANQSLLLQLLAVLPWLLLFALILRHRGFRNEAMLDEALGIMLGANLLLGIIPEIWRYR